jgi:phage shock protein PspC (stress-responsive transcriptional regulator)
MKKNITINLCGRLFQIDEDAYEMLQQYIESLRSSFGREEGGDEIVDDIEARIAELFDELRQQGIEAITIDHVKDIITRIGRPEELTGNDNVNDNHNDNDNDNDNHNDNVNDNHNNGHRYDSFRSAAQDVIDNVRARTAGKRLYRNPKDKMLTGVCSGLAAYTNTDPVIWRLLFVLLVLFYGVGIISYIALAIIVPEARTPEQLLQMEGKDVTPQNLADVVVDKEERPVRHPSLIRSFFTVILKMLAGLLMVLFVIAGLALLVCFLLAAGSLIVVFTVPEASHHSLPFNLDYLNLPELYAAHPWLVIIFIASLLLVFLTPLYAIVHGLLAKAGKLKPMGIWQNVAWIVIWLIAMFSNFPSLLALQDLRHKLRESLVHTGGTVTPYAINDIPMMEQDYKYFLENNWVMVKTDNTEESYATLTSKGEYYTGNIGVWYLNGHEWDEDQQLVYQAEHTEWVEPGVYSLSCVVRADGWGTFVYTVCNGEKQLKDIPARGFKGGELWESANQSLDSLKATKRPASREQRHWYNIARANHSRGYGWSELRIDSIVVTHDSIPVVYGVSTVPEFTGHPCHTKQFSATDFKLTRTGDLPGTAQ